MLKIVIFDCGYGGELFADQLAEALPVVEIIRVIDWHHASEIQSSPRRARRHAEDALHPYIGRVDLIIFANYLLAATSLRYFQRKYKPQPFLGLGLKSPDTYVKRDVLILTTRPLARTLAYRKFRFRLGLQRRARTIALDAWPAKIDDGVLTDAEIATAFTDIKNSIKNTTKSTTSSTAHQGGLKNLKRQFKPAEVILTCSQFSDIKPALKKALGGNLKFYDGFSEAIYQTHKILKIRGGLGKKAK